MHAYLERLRIIDRYLLARYLVPFGYCLAAFLLVMLIYDFSINLEDFIDGKVRLDVVLEYFIYSLPMKLTDIIPMASLLSILFSIGQLKRHNEILALQASGVSTTRMLIPFLCFGFLLSVLVLIMNETLLPHCRERVAKIEAVYMKKGDAAKVGAAASVFAFYNLRQQRSWVGIMNRPKDILERVEIREFDSQDNVKRKISAETAQGMKDGWKLTSGKEMLYAPEEIGKGEARSFQEEIFRFPETMQDLEDSQKDTLFMSLGELRMHIRIHPKHSRVYHEERVEYYHKWAYPFLNLLVMLMGVPVGLQSEKGHFFLGVGKSLGLFLGYYLINLVSLTLGKNEVLAAWLGAWVPNIALGAVGIALIRRNT